MVKCPYLHHSTPYTCFSRSGTDFQPRHLALIFRESPVDNYVSNSQVDASRESMHGFQLACSVQLREEGFKVGQDTPDLVQLRLLLVDLRPFLQCLMLQHPELGNPLSHLLDRHLGNRKSSLELSDVSVVLGDLPVCLGQPVGTIELRQEAPQLLTEVPDEYWEQVVLPELCSTGLLPVSSALARILGLIVLRAPVSAQEMSALHAVDHPAKEGQR